MGEVSENWSPTICATHKAELAQQLERVQTDVGRALEPLPELLKEVRNIGKQVVEMGAEIKHVHERYREDVASLRKAQDGTIADAHELTKEVANLRRAHDAHVATYEAQSKSSESALVSTRWWVGIVMGLGGIAVGGVQYFMHMFLEGLVVRIDKLAEAVQALHPLVR